MKKLALLALFAVAACSSATRSRPELAVARGPWVLVQPDLPTPPAGAAAATGIRLTGSAAR